MGFPDPLSGTVKQKHQRPRPTIAQRQATVAADIARVRQREEARLLRIARKAGFFKKRIATPEIRALFDGQQGTRQSQLARLEDEMKRIKKQTTEADRREDARRKILLGAFLIAQFGHKPALRTELRPELEQFLDLHRDAKVAAANKALLAEYLT